MPLSLLVNQRAVAHSIAQQNRARMEYQHSLQGSVPSDQVEVKAFRPRSLLAGFVAGLDSLMPNVVSLRQGGMSFGMAELLDNPTMALFGKIDLLFIVKFVLSLVAIILTFNMICGEKESGTLRLLLSNPIPRDSVLLGKLLSVFVTLVVPLVLGLLMSILVLRLVGDSRAGAGNQWGILGALLGISMLYIGVFVNLGMLVSVLVSRSLTAITALLFLWSSLIAFVPQFGGLLAETIYPVESTESFLLKKSLIAQDLDRQRAAELSQYFGHPDYERLRQPIAMKYASRLQRLYAQMDQEYYNRRQIQLRLASAMASLSPAAPLTFAFTTLCGTGVGAMKEFNERLNEFRRHVNEQLFAQGYRDLLPGRGGMLHISTVDLRDVPHFSYEQPPMAVRLQSIWMDVVLLMSLNAGLFLAAYLRFRRYDVR